MGKDTQQFNSIVQDVFGIKAEDSATPDSVENWTSLTHMELVSKLSDAFGIELDVEEITKMESIAAVKAVLHEHGVDA